MVGEKKTSGKFLEVVQENGDCSKDISENYEAKTEKSGEVHRKYTEQSEIIASTREQLKESESLLRISYCDEVVSINGIKTTKAIDEEKQTTTSSESKYGLDVNDALKDCSFEADQVSLRSGIIFNYFLRHLVLLIIPNTYA